MSFYPSFILLLAHFFFCFCSVGCYIWFFHFLIQLSLFLVCCVEFTSFRSNMHLRGFLQSLIFHLAQSKSRFWVDIFSNISGFSSHISWYSPCMESSGVDPRIWEVFGCCWCSSCKIPLKCGARCIHIMYLYIWEKINSVLLIFRLQTYNLCYFWAKHLVLTEKLTWVFLLKLLVHFPYFIFPFANWPTWRRNKMLLTIPVVARGYLIY